MTMDSSLTVVAAVPRLVLGGVIVIQGQCGHCLLVQRPAGNIADLYGKPMPAHMCSQRIIMASAGNTPPQSPITGISSVATT